MSLIEWFPKNTQNWINKLNWNNDDTICKEKQYFFFNGIKFMKVGIVGFDVRSNLEINRNRGKCADKAKKNYNPDKVCKESISDA